MGRDCYSFVTISRDPREATKFITDFLFNKIYPLMLRIRDKLQSYDGALYDDDLAKLRNVYALCSSQIKKCIQTLFIVFKMEYQEQMCLQESRHCALERLSWCLNKLLAVEEHLDSSCKKVPQTQGDSSTDSILATPMYFVNWIDHTFDILSKLATAIYKTDYKDSEDLCNQWKSDVSDHAGMLHISVDELLLSAMTLGRYCLPTDQLIIKARCQVVLRETKALLGELITGDLDSAFKAIPESLKLPIMPSNVNVLIDVLKDVLYVLETNTNTALLALLVHCFSNSVSPVDVLKEHFGATKGSCSCLVNSEDITEDCTFVKDFDLYNERLLQIGSFAVSCSSDQHRILSLRSGLATLEALDPHLVPAVTLSPRGRHAALLADSWRQEVREIRDSVFLIVDPAAFAEKSKHLMHQTLLEILMQKEYNNSKVCQVINIGCVVHDFFSVYNVQEPDALTHQARLLPLLADLNKVQLECKIVSNLLSSENDFLYDVKKSKSDKEVSYIQLTKRLKLLYTLISRINSLLHPKDNDDQLFEGDEEDVPKNITHTLYPKNSNTYVQSPRKLPNFSRSVFARTNIRSSTANVPLAKLTKHLMAKKSEDLSFSVQLDELFNLSEAKTNTENIVSRKQFESVRECSVLYNFSPNKRTSLRKAVLNRHCKMPFDRELKNHFAESTSGSDKGSLMDEATSLQITDILNQMSDITNIFSRTKPLPAASTKTFHQNLTQNICDDKDSNVVRVDVNDANTAIARHIWNIPVNASTDFPLDDSTGTMASNVTLPSNVTTLERINDIDLVESRLNSLKSLDLETSL